MLSTEQIVTQVAQKSFNARPAVNGLSNTSVYSQLAKATSAKQNFIIDDLDRHTGERYDYSRGFLELPYSATYTRRGFCAGAGPVIPEQVPDGLALPPQGYIAHIRNCYITDKHGVEYTCQESQTFSDAEFSIASYWLAMLKDSRETYLANAELSGRSHCMPREEMEGHVSGGVGTLSTTFSTFCRNCYITSGQDPLVGPSSRPFYGRRAINRGLFERLIGSSYPLAALTSEENLPSWDHTAGTVNAGADTTYSITLNYTAFVPIRDLCDVFRVMPPTWRGLTFGFTQQIGALSTTGVSFTEGPGGAAVGLSAGCFPWKLTDRATASESGVATIASSVLAASDRRVSIDVALLQNAQNAGIGGKGGNLGGVSVRYGTGQLASTAVHPPSAAPVADTNAAWAATGDSFEMKFITAITTTVMVHPAAAEAKMQDSTVSVSVRPHATRFARIVVPKIMVNPVLLREMMEQPVRFAYEQFRDFRISASTLCGTALKEFSLGSAYNRASRLLLIPVRATESDTCAVDVNSRVWSHEPALPSIGYRIQKVSLANKKQVDLLGDDADRNDSSTMFRAMSSCGLYDAQAMASALVIDLRDYPDVIRSGELKLSCTVVCTLPGGNGVARYQLQVFGFDEAEVIFDDRLPIASSNAAAAVQRSG